MEKSWENNIAARLPQWALKCPERIALEVPRNLAPVEKTSFHYDSLTFSKLNALSSFYAEKLKATGLKEQDKVLVFVRPSLDFSAITFALFKAGLVPVFIDPGMGRKNLLEAVAQISPKGLIAEPEVHLLRLLFQKSFSSIEVFVTTKGFTWGKMNSLKKWKDEEFFTFKESFKQTFQNKDNIASLVAKVAPSDTAAILFTSGGTGVPKGVRYTHHIFNQQTDRLKELFSLNEDEIDLPGFPLFGLFTISMGMKSVIPAMNPSKPGECNPAWIVQNIQDKEATFVAGSPAIWKRVGEYCKNNKITLPTVKYLVMFGAPVSIELHETLKPLLPHGDTYTPYGATECLPVANISGEEVTKYYKEKILTGRGTCVGKPVQKTTIKIAQITDEVLEFSDIQWQEQGVIGEVCVLSETVTPEYVGMEQKTKEAKFHDPDGNLWHRMGDLGYLDEEGALWFCGRKGHRMEIRGRVVPAVPYETPLLSISNISKCAFVAPLIKNDVTPLIIVEPTKKVNLKERMAIQSEVLKRTQELIPDAKIERVLFTKKFPVDVRHNIKIDRVKLKELVEQGKIQ